MGLLWGLLVLEENIAHELYATANSMVIMLDVRQFDCFHSSEGS